MNTEQLKAFYRERIGTNSVLLGKVKRKSHVVGTFRLLVVLLAALGVYLCWGQSGWVVALILFALVVLVALIKYHNTLFFQRDYYETSVRADEEELAAIEYNFSAFDGAKERVSPSHEFGLDLDLFGDRSLFQSLNRTVTPDGKAILADWFELPLCSKVKIEERQQAVEELKSLCDLRQGFRVSGLLSHGEDMSPDGLRAFVAEPDCIPAQKKRWKALTYFYPAFWLLTIVLVSIAVWSPSFIGMGIVLLYAVSESKTKKINRLQDSLAKKVKVFSSYANLIRLIEENKFQCTELQSTKNELTKDGRTVSSLIKELSGLLSNLDQRSSGLGRFILNTLLLWDIRYTLKIEEWKAAYGQDLDKWMSAIGKFDAFCSLGTFAFNHDEYIFPEATDTYFSLQAKALGHPMMHREVCVKNDVRIDKHPYFLIITGANMAGKSTYLRTVGVNYLLASVGAPVCAASFRFYPARLVTSLRTSDSLSDNESYFFAELKRLKMIIDKLKNGEQLFVILDEILKGTNSVDKQKGSIALMKQLIGMDACGIIATHDLALGQLINDFPGNISNYRFEADIRENELSFSYSMQPGVAENMNACFLMNKMGITVG